mmetsp:Transcript_31520/g.52154  ORF Transcript_31520/g.52154 Transcript_31520/m.52154 type:complete len:92 (-) Transcript_31520:1039-1314(-)
MARLCSMKQHQHTYIIFQRPFNILIAHAQMKSHPNKMNALTTPSYANGDESDSLTAAAIQARLLTAAMLRAAAVRQIGQRSPTCLRVLSLA